MAGPVSITCCVRGWLRSTGGSDVCVVERGDCKWTKAAADADLERAIKDLKLYATQLQPGHLVLMKETKLGSRIAGTATKLFMQTTGPHQVIRKMPDSDIYEIQLGDSKLRKKVPGERLQKLPPTIEEPFHHRLHWVLEGSEDQTG